MGNLFNKVPKSIVHKLFLPFIISQAQTQQYYISRMNACQLIGRVPIFYFDNSFVTIINNLLRDSNLKVVLKMAENLPKIYEIYFPEFEDYFLELLMSLVQSTNIDINLAIVKIFPDVSHKFTNNSMKKLLPFFKNL